MYLAALGRQNSSVSTYFTESLEGVGGGGSPKKTTSIKNKKSPDKSQGRKTKGACYQFDRLGAMFFLYHQEGTEMVAGCLLCRSYRSTLS